MNVNLKAKRIVLFQLTHGFKKPMSYLYGMEDL